MLRNWFLLFTAFLLLLSVDTVFAQNNANDRNNDGTEQEVAETPPTFLERLMFWRRDRDRERYRNPYEDYTQQELDNELWIALSDNDAAKMRELLNEGASSNTRNMHQRTILIEAARIGYLDGVRVLIDFGASINSRDMYGGTAYTYASRGGHHEIVFLLQRNGARTN